MKKLLAIVLSLVLAAIGFGSVVQAQDDSQQNVLIISWSGADRESVRELLDAGQLPNLEALIDDGSIVSIDILRDSGTRAGNVAMLTGYNPELTGCYNRNRLEPVPDGWTIFERIDGSYFTGYVGAKGAALDNIEGKIFQNTSQNIDFYAGQVGNNKTVRNMILGLIEDNQDDPFFIFSYFRQPDRFGHVFGGGSPEYYKGLLNVDYQLGLIIDRLKELGLYDDTIVYVLSDHGFNMGYKDHFDAPYAFLASNTELMRCGLRIDIAPTIYDALRIDWERFSPPLDGHSLYRHYNPPMLE